MLNIHRNNWCWSSNTCFWCKEPTWPSDAKSQLTGKHPDAGKVWWQEKRATEDKMAGWHHQLNGHDFEQTPGDSVGPGSLVCCSPWGHQELTGLNNWTTTKTRDQTHTLCSRSGSLNCQGLPGKSPKCISLPVQFSCSVISDCLWPHGLQYARLPCPLPTLGAYSNSCPSSQWCHPTFSASVVPFSSHL